MSTLLLRAARGAVIAVIAGLTGATLASAPALAADPVVYDPTVDNTTYAYHLDPADEINGGDYTVTWDPTSRTDDGVASGSKAGNFGPGNIAVDTGCPEGFRRSSRTLLITPAGLETAAATARSNVTAAAFGLQGNPISLTSIRASAWGALTETTNPTGVNAYVITCDAPTAETGYPGTSDPLGNSKYFVTYFAMDWSTNHWEVTSKPGGGTVKVDTSVAASASGVSATSATLSATVAPAEATGTVTFTSGSFSQTAPVSGGTAGVSISGLTPATEYAFTAEYSGDATHNGSTGSVTLTTLAAADSSNSDVSVTVPTAASTDPAGLSISAKPGAVALSNAAARTQGQNWTASGPLGNVTITDDRRNAGAGSWTLSGSTSAFVSGANTIAASQLGWTPAKVAGAGSAGAQATDLSSAKPLATGGATAETAVTTTVGAQLALVVPSGAAAGDYKATLTLTLI